MLYEIRNYHVDPTYFEEFKAWMREMAFPFLSSRMDIVGAWFKNEMPPIYGGSQPIDETVNPANYTWIIRWNNREQRDKAFEDLRSSEFQQIISMIPGGTQSVLMTEAKFVERV
jgi:hypothetical protein